MKRQHETRHTAHWEVELKVCVNRLEFAYLSLERWEGQGELILNDI